jgi:suppressor of ftsI
VNASADHYADVRYTAGPLDVVALDGQPLLWRNPGVVDRRLDHVLLPPASRVEAIVQAPPAGTTAQLRTECFDTGKDGDPNPAAVLADVNVAGTA